tara:strand:- start:191 stop:325 length:135 start_codon:yes stop_codon:yes gene_type:complete
MRKAKGAEYAPRAQHKKRPGVHKKSMNKSEKLRAKKGRYKGQGR